MSDPEQPPPSPYQPSQQPPPPQPGWGQQPGYPPQQPYPLYPTQAPNEGMAVAAMVVGIVSIVLACGYGIGLLGSPIALVMGRVSMKRIDASGGQLGGRGMAQAGFILGIIGTILLVLALAVVIFIVVAASNGAFDYDNF